MIILNVKEHTSCYNYDNSELPMIEVVRITKGTHVESGITNSEIVFFLEGRLRYTVEGYPDYERMKGQILFQPVNSHLSYTALNHTVLMIFRPYKNMRLCDNYRIEELYERDKSENAYKPRNTFAALEINPRLWHFIDGINDCLSDGLKCKSYFEAKITELFIFLRAYYPKEQLREFLYPILSPDTAFSERVRLFCWDKSRSVDELAEHMNLSPRQFTKKFKRVFDTTPYQWIKKGKVERIWQELTTTDKPIKQVAADYGFGSLGQFTNFCKDELGKTPSDIRNNEKVEK